MGNPLLEKVPHVLAWERLTMRDRIAVLDYHAHGLNTRGLAEEDNFNDLPPVVQEKLKRAFGGIFFAIPRVARNDNRGRP